MKQLLKNKWLPANRIIYSVVFILVVFLGPTFTGTATAVTGSTTSNTAYFNPLSGTYSIGTQFTISVHVDPSASQWNNAYVTFTVPGNLGYVTNTLNGGGTGTVASLGSSQFKLSYYSKTIVSGNIVISTLTFKAKSAGTGTLVMNSSYDSLYEDNYTALFTQNATYTVPSPPVTTTPPPANTTPPPSSTSPSSPPATTKSSPPSSSKPSSTFKPVPTSNGSSSNPGSSTPSLTTDPSAIPDLTNSSNPTYGSDTTGQQSQTSHIKSSKSNSHVALWSMLFIIPIALFIGFVLIRRRRLATVDYDNYYSEPVPLPELPEQGNEVPASKPLDPNEQAISAAIDKAFYPRGHNAETIKNEQDKKA